MQQHQPGQQEQLAPRKHTANARLFFFALLLQGVPAACVCPALYTLDHPSPLCESLHPLHTAARSNMGFSRWTKGSSKIRPFQTRLPWVPVNQTHKKPLLYPDHRDSPFLGRANLGRHVSEPPRAPAAVGFLLWHPPKFLPAHAAYWTRPDHFQVSTAAVPKIRVWGVLRGC